MMKPTCKFSAHIFNVHFAKALTFAVTVLILLFAPAAGMGADVDLAWDANTEDDLKGYIVYYGTASRNYPHNIDVGDTTQHRILDLQDGTTYYFAVKAYDYDNNQSSYSDELVYTVPVQNSAPGKPSAPAGPAGGYRQTTYSFNTSAADPDGDPLQYRFDWGDGVISTWGTSSRTHAWSSTGNFCLKAQARDSQDAVSVWSNCGSISIAENTHTITASAGSNGSISPAGAVTVNHGTGQSFSITPAQGYQIQNVIVDGVSIGTPASHTFANVTQNHTITASFALIPAPVLDSDKDGVPDAQDAFPFDPTETLDTDHDRLGNNADPDDDNDGMPDNWEILYGFDPLNKNDALDDPDNDGVSNLDEFLAKTEPNAFEDFDVPEQPFLLAPVDSEIVSLTPELQTDVFYDPDTDDVHVKSQWQIFRADDSSCVFDVTSTSSLTSIQIPKLILEEDTDYVWKVRFFNNHDAESAWSEYGAFVTDYSERDVDGNGIPDDQEVDAGVDLDGDRTADRLQDDIKCVQMAGKTDQVGISVRNAENVDAIISIEIEEPTTAIAQSKSKGKPQNVQYGLINFKLLVSEPGAESVVTLYLSKSALAKGKWYKYDPIEGTWQDYSEFTGFGADRKTVYLTLKDGGFGDADGLANGIIVDPLAFGTEAESVAVDPDADDVKKLLGVEIPKISCFISSVTPRSADGKPSSLWREIRGREPAILFALVIITFLARAVFSWIRLNHRRLKAQL